VLEPTDSDLYEDNDENTDADKDQEEPEEENRLSEAQDAMVSAIAQAQSAALVALTQTMNLNTYTTKTYNGGVYRESVVLQDGEMPTSKRGLRNGLAQQLLHEQMVQMQYE